MVDPVTGWFEQAQANSLLISEDSGHGMVGLLPHTKSNWF